MVTLSSRDRGSTAFVSSHGSFASKVLTEDERESRAAIFE
jgi:hypothetical protein